MNAMAFTSPFSPPPPPLHAFCARWRTCNQKVLSGCLFILVPFIEVLSPTHGPIGLYANCHYLFLISPSFDVSRGLCFIFVASYLHLYFSSPELLGQRRAYSIDRLPRPSDVRRPHSSNIFSSETTGIIKAKFHIEPQWVGRTKVSSPHLDRMTRMTATPIYDKKNPLKTFISSTKGPITLGLCMQHWGILWSENRRPRSLIFGM